MVVKMSERCIIRNALRAVLDGKCYMGVYFIIIIHKAYQTEKVYLGKQRTASLLPRRLCSLSWFAPGAIAYLTCRGERIDEKGKDGRKERKEGKEMTDATCCFSSLSGDGIHGALTAIPLQNKLQSLPKQLLIHYYEFHI